MFGRDGKELLKKVVAVATFDHHRHYYIWKSALGLTITLDV